MSAVKLLTLNIGIVMLSVFLVSVMVPCVHLQGILTKGKLSVQLTSLC